MHLRGDDSSYICGEVEVIGLKPEGKSKSKPVSLPLQHQSAFSVCLSFVRIHCPVEWWPLLSHPQRDKVW